MVEALELKPQPDLESRVKGIEEDGYAYFPGAMSADQVAELKEVMKHLTPIEASFNRYTTPDNGGFLNKHINNAFNRDPIFLQYMDQAGVIDLAEAIHGDDCHIIGMTAWVTGPGRPDQQLHCDWLPVELPEDVQAAHHSSAQGVGLFRTEFLFMNRREPPSEEEQYSAYSGVVERMQLPVTIRTLDLLSLIHI